MFQRRWDYWTLHGDVKNSASTRDDDESDDDFVVGRTQKGGKRKKKTSSRKKNQKKVIFRDASNTYAFEHLDAQKGDKGELYMGIHLLNDPYLTKMLMLPKSILYHNVFLSDS